MMKRLIVWIWIWIFVAIGASVFPTDKVKSFLKENDSIDAVWAKLSRPCPEPERCYPCPYQEQKECPNETDVSYRQISEAYEKGHKNAVQEITRNLIAEGSATIRYHGEVYKATIEKVGMKSIDQSIPLQEN